MRMSGNEWRGHWMSPALGGVKDGPGQPVKWIFGLGDSRLDRDAYGLWTVERWALDGLETLEKGGRGKEKKKGEGGGGAESWSCVSMQMGSVTVFKGYGRSESSLASGMLELLRHGARYGAS